MTSHQSKAQHPAKQMGEDRVGTVMLFDVPIVCMYIDSQERLCLAQISNTILRDFSYNEIHNRRVALGITCMQCSPSQLEVLRRTGAMPVSSRRCGLITKREAERLVKSFIEEIPPPRLPEDFAFKVSHACGWGCKGLFMPSRYNSSRAKCIKCFNCDSYFSPNKFIFHYHKLAGAEYKHPDAANFNSWRRHLVLADSTPSETLLHAWEDVKAMFNGGCRKRFSTGHRSSSYMPRPDVSDTAADSRFSRPSETPFSMSGYGAFYPPTSRTHAAFPAPMFGRITSYGDYLRSLSLPYNNPWPGKLDFARSPLGMSPQASTADQFGMSGQVCLPLNVPYPRRVLPESTLVSNGPLLDPGPSMSSSLSLASSQPCFPEKMDLTFRESHVQSTSGKVVELGDVEDSSHKRQRPSVPEPDSSIDVEKNDEDDGKMEKRSFNSTEWKEYSDATETTENKIETYSLHTKFQNEAKTDVTLPCDSSLDELFDMKTLDAMPIDTLRDVVSRAITQRKTAEKDHKKIKNMLRVRALKELEVREDFARQFCSIKENLWSDIEKERSAKGEVEDKLKETQKLLQRLSRQVPDTLVSPSFK